MNKFLLICFIIFGLYTLGTAQSSAFVLIDVSGSGPNRNMKEEAKLISRDLIQGKFDAQRFSNWTWLAKTGAIEDIVNGSGKPLVDPNQDGYIMIMPFGEKDTYKKYTVEKVNNTQNDVINFYNTYYPKNYYDDWTYPEIARAKAASVAKGNQVNIDSYFLIEISDQLKDSDSRPPNYSREEQVLLAEYGTASSFEIKLATLRNNYDNSNFQVVVKQVNVKKINIQGSNPNAAQVSRKNLTLLRPTVTNSKSKPRIERKGSVSILWKCLGCDSTNNFVVRVNNTDNKSIRFNKKTTQTNARFKIDEPGVYKVTVGSSGIGTRTGYFKIEGESSGGGFFLFLLAALAGLGYYFYNNNRNQNDDDDDNGNRQTYQPRSPSNNPPPTNTGGDNVEYF